MLILKKCYVRLLQGMIPWSPSPTQMFQGSNALLERVDNSALAKTSAIIYWKHVSAIVCNRR